MERRTVTTTTTTAQVISLTVVLALIAVCSLVLPLALAGQTGFFAKNLQYFIGPAVNAALIYSALKIRGRVSIAAIICAPSVFALTCLLFAVGTVYAAYMIPVIWAGNLVFVLMFRILNAKRKVNYIVTAVIAVAVKVAIIFGGFSLLVAVNVIPAGSAVAAAMTTMMSIVQVFTAVTGCVIAWSAVQLADRRAAVTVK